MLLEADLRHTEILVSNEHGKPLLPQSIKEQLLSTVMEQKLTDAEASVFRSDEARSNYLGLVCVVIVYPAKELRRRMFTSDRASQLALQRLVRYLKGSPRLVR